MNRQLGLIIVFFTALSGATNVSSQVAAGGNFTLDQAVVASGGGQNSTGGAFALDGTIGQSIAGTTSSNNPFVVTGGFWTAPPLAPTAASVSVRGRILTPDGRGLRNARVILTDMQGNARAAMSGTFGYYRFPEVEVGQTYVFTVVSKRYQFAPQVLSIMEEVEDLNFVAQAQTLREQ